MTHILKEQNHSPLP